MLRTSLLAFAFLSFPALAAVPAGDCVFFNAPDLSGTAFTALINNEAYQLPDTWENQASSVLVRTGFTLEVYPDINFLGTRTDIGETTDAGMNLATLGLDKQVSSFRCRKAAEPKILQNSLSFDWFEGGDYRWNSDGNHPQHKQLTMKTEADELIVRLHADDTYGTNVADFTMNLSQGRVHVEYLTAGHIKGSSDFDLQQALGTAEFKAAIKDMVGHVQVIMKGTGNVPNVEAPKPELASVVAFLNRYVN